MPNRKTRRISTAEDGSIQKVVHKQTASGYKRKEVTKKDDGTKMVRKVKSKHGHVKTKTRRRKR